MYAMNNVHTKEGGKGLGAARRKQSRKPLDRSLVTASSAAHCNATTATELTMHTACSSQFTLHTARCTVHTEHWTLQCNFCTLHTTHCTLHTAHCNLITALHTTYCTLHWNPHCTMQRHTAYCIAIQTEDCNYLKTIIISIANWASDVVAKLI